MDEFHAAYSQANLLYGLDISPETFEEIGLIAWDKIGNKQYRLYRYVADIDKQTLSIELPCNCDEVEAVTYSFEDWNYTTNTTVNGDYQSQFIEQYIEGRKLYEHPFYISGKYAKYEKVGDTLYFDKDYGRVMILYKGFVLDDVGLPYLNPKEVDAIACYCAMTQKFKEGWSLNNQGMLQEAQLLEQRWQKLCDEARIPMYISQNEMNQILDAKSSWNRKLFNKSYKPIK
jgi:hypothetical protein